MPCDSVPALDRGLHYGDGLFETLAVRDGSPLALEDHLRRLAHGLERLSIPALDMATLKAQAQAQASALGDGVLKILVTRGVGGRGYAPDPAGAPTRALLCYPWPAYPARFRRDGVRLRICTTRLGLNPALAGLKHNNRLEQVLARAEWDDPAVPEGLMLDASGRVVEGTMSNVFLVTERRLRTPDLSQAGVTGIVRESIRALGSVGALPPVEVAHLGLEDFLGADEVFVCNSVLGIWPVHGVEGLDVRWAAPGPITREVAARLRDARTIADD